MKLVYDTANLYWTCGTGGLSRSNVSGAVLIRKIKIGQTIEKEKRLKTRILIRSGIQIKIREKC